MMKNLFFLAIIFCSNFTYAQSLKPKVSVVVNGPEDGAVSLTATIDKSTLSKDLLKIRYKWIVIDDNKIRDNITIWPDGTQVFFGVGNPPRKITVILWTVCLFENNELEFLDSIVNTIGEKTLPSPVLLPVPAPTIPIPAPNINVILPDGRFKAAQKTYDLVMQNVPPSSRRACKSLSTSFSSISSSIASGQMSNPQDILKSVKTINSAALAILNIPTSDFQQWNKLYGDFIYDLYINKKLNVSKDWQDLFNETAAGFAAVK